MSDKSGWTARVLIRAESGGAAERLAGALGPEAAREVPRAGAIVERPKPEIVRLRIRARDTGALRAALNTYLGWVALAAATEQAVKRK
ncbi:MAG TPA: KEOPS complex subunit Pcc1 [Thermoplasmata archaeon]|nr:KEOPS complex subunit Pcc1 [Thermoplasmata archaeon]